MYVMTEAVQDIYDKYIDVDQDLKCQSKEDFVVQANLENK